MTELLNGRYELGEIVGSGGMGAVYRAHDTRLKRPVAIKVLRAGPLADEHSRARMRAEAHLAAAIVHPGVAQVFDFDEDERFPGTTFIVMQFVQGHTLADLLRERGAMEPAQVMSLVVQVAEALQAAHEAGVVHRDLKPANIMLTPRGRVVLVDFGIAHSAASDPLTDTGTLIGTADYMSPEQAGGGRASPQSDLYALGVIAHHCLTGASPFRRESHIATALAHLRDDLPALGHDVPADVATLVSSLTARDPAKRPTTAAAVALQAALAGAADVIDLPTSLSTASRPPVVDLPRTGELTPGGSQVARASVARRPRAMYAGIGLLAVILSYLGLEQIRTGADTVVPGVVGMQVDQATERVRDEGMSPRLTSIDRPGTPAGQVVEQHPEGGAAEPDDGKVTLTVASGKVHVEPDAFIGMSYADASAELRQLGLTVKRKDVTQSTDVGEVVALSRSGRVADGSTITLSVAVAPVARATSSTSSSKKPTTKNTAKSSPSTGKAKGKGKGKGKGL